ncbi:MAG: TolC family protein [Alphaproteobacteria bacterium]
MALPLAACVAAPSTTPSQVPVESSSLGLGAQPAPHVQADWWKAFDDPQLDRLVAQLLTGNPTLLGALARIRAAQAELSVARTAQYPNINIDGSETRQLLSNNYLYPRPFGGSWQWVGDAEARFRWSLDFWGKQAALIDRASNASVAAALDADAAKLALAGMFAQSYVELLLAWQNLDIAHETVDERQTILDLTQSRVTAGLENEASLEQAKALLALSRMEVRRAEAQRDVAVHAIAALTGQGAQAYAGITRPAAGIENALPLPKSLPADLLARRPDILAAQARILAEYDASLSLRIPSLHFWAPHAVMPGIEPHHHENKIPAVFNYYSVGTAREKAEKRATPDNGAVLPWPPQITSVTQTWPRRSSPLFLHVIDQGHDVQMSLHFYQDVVSPAEQYSFTQQLFQVFAETVPA